LHTHGESSALSVNEVIDYFDLMGMPQERLLELESEIGDGKKTFSELEQLAQGYGATLTDVGKLRFNLRVGSSTLRYQLAANDVSPPTSRFSSAVETQTRMASPENMISHELHSQISDDAGALLKTLGMRAIREADLPHERLASAMAVAHSAQARTTIGKSLDEQRSNQLEPTPLDLAYSGYAFFIRSPHLHRAPSGSSEENLLSEDEKTLMQQLDQRRSSMESTESRSSMDGSLQRTRSMHAQYSHTAAFGDLKPRVWNIAGPDTVEPKRKLKHRVKQVMGSQTPAFASIVSSLTNLQTTDQKSSASRRGRPI